MNEQHCGATRVPNVKCHICTRPESKWLRQRNHFVSLVSGLCPNLKKRRGLNITSSESTCPRFPYSWLFIMGLQRQPKCLPSRKQPYNRTSSHSYNLRSRPLMRPLCDSPSSLLTPPAVHPFPSTPLLCDSSVHPSSQHLTRFPSILSLSGLSVIFATPPSSPSAPIPPVQSHPLKCEIKTTNDVGNNHWR